LTDFAKKKVDSLSKLVCVIDKSAKKKKNFIMTAKYKLGGFTHISLSKHLHSLCLNPTYV